MIQDDTHKFVLPTLGLALLHELAIKIIIQRLAYRSISPGQSLDWESLFGRVVSPQSAHLLLSGSGSVGAWTNLGCMLGLRAETKQWMGGRSYIRRISVGSKGDENRESGKAATCVQLHSWVWDWRIGFGGRKGAETFRKPNWFFSQARTVS